MDIRYSIKSFHQLSTIELYEILKLRQKVFVVEQNCPYLDNDDLDQDSFHLCGYYGIDLIAYSRLIPPDMLYEGHSAIGRVINDSSVRGKGIGKNLMSHAISISQALFANKPIKIGAQTYLKEFYEDFGFQQVGEEYLEDGILHIHMILNSQ